MAGSSNEAPPVGAAGVGSEYAGRAVGVFGVTTGPAVVPPSGTAGAVATGVGFALPIGWATIGTGEPIAGVAAGIPYAGAAAGFAAVSGTGVAGAVAVGPPSGMPAGATFGAACRAGLRDEPPTLRAGWPAAALMSSSGPATGLR